MRKLNDEQIKMIDINRIKIKDNVWVVLLNTGGHYNIPEYEYNHNVYCINNNHEIIWQIKSDRTGFERDSFVSVGFNKYGNLSARNFTGFIYEVDINTGETTRIGWDK